MRRQLALGAAVGIGVLLLGVWIGVGIGHGGSSAGIDVRERHLEYCRRVRNTLHDDILDFESPQYPAARIHAADRFLAGGAFHSYHDVRLCSRALPPLLQLHTQCWLRNDFHCLAILASAAEAAVRDYIDELR